MSTNNIIAFAIIMRLFLCRFHFLYVRCFLNELYLFSNIYIGSIFTIYNIIFMNV